MHGNHCEVRLVQCSAWAIVLPLPSFLDGGSSEETPPPPLTLVRGVGVRQASKYKRFKEQYPRKGIQIFLNDLNGTKGLVALGVTDNAWGV